MLINLIEQTAPGVWKLTPDGGSAFFLREDYLSLLSPSLLAESCLSDTPLELGDCLFNDVVSAGLAYAAEVRAMSYLARSEQCRAGLACKLAKKGHDAAGIKAALDYLEERGFLDDRRFAGAWLRSRAIDHAEGRLRLAAELAARGIGRDDTASALNEFFSENDEGQLCCRALLRLKKTCADKEKLFRSLIRKGFTSSEIRDAMVMEET
ncbi:MAG: regulatory protein RecX [Treponema sp.]|nr:regulatory protein RecX [Treponema sp.]